MYYVYYLRSIHCPKQTYVGYTTNLEKHMQKHNSGLSIYTNKFKPWKSEVIFNFRNRKKAMDFEKYLKTGSGRAFIKRHFKKNIPPIPTSQY